MDNAVHRKTRFFLLLSLTIFSHPAFSVCHTLTSNTSASAVPSEYAVPYNVFSDHKELLLQSFCNNTDITFYAGNDSPNFIVSKKGYYLDRTTNQWVEFSFNGSSYSDAYLLGAGNVTFNFTAQQLHDGVYFIAYTCYRNDSEWKCGCRDTQCTDSKWQLQKAQIPIAELPTDDKLSVTDELYTEAATHESVFAKISNLQSGLISPKDVNDSILLFHANPTGIRDYGDTVVSHWFDNSWQDNLGFDSSFNTVYDNYGAPGPDSEGVFEVISVTDEGGTIRGTTNTNAYYFSYDGLNDWNGGAITINQWVNYLERISATYGQIGRLTIFAHGNSGIIKMSDDFWLTTENLINDLSTRDQLMRLRNILHPDAHILLFSCKVANNGTEFVQELANLTGSTVHANKEYTGDYKFSIFDDDTDWSLDAVASPIEN